MREHCDPWRSDRDDWNSRERQGQARDRCHGLGGESRLHRYAGSIGIVLVDRQPFPKQTVAGDRQRNHRRRRLHRAAKPAHDRAAEIILDHYHLSTDWQDLAGDFHRLEKSGTPINLGTYVGASQVRQAVLGDVDRAPTPAELQQMESLVAAAMQQGAFGLSTALIYPPGHYATTTELIALAKIASRYGGIYASHMRSEG